MLSTLIKEDVALFVHFFPAGINEPAFAAVLLLARFDPVLALQEKSILWVPVLPQGVGGESQFFRRAGG